MRSWNPSGGVRLAGASCLGALVALSVYARDSPPAVVASEPVVATSRDRVPAATPAGVDPLGLNRLARRSSAMPRPVVHGRSPFRFAIRSQAAAARPPVAPPMADAGRAAESADPAPLPPALVGIVTAAHPDGAARTAVFSTSAGTIEFGRVGDLMDGARYRLRSIDADGVTLVDALTGAITAMRLR